VKVNNASQLMELLALLPGTYINEKGEIICGACGQVIGTKERNLYSGNKLPDWISKIKRERDG